MRSGPELSELSAGQFTAELTTLMGIYALAMNPDPAQLPGRRAVMQRHTSYPAFRAVIALAVMGGSQHPGPAGAASHTPIGFAYGFHGGAGQWWHDLVAASMTTDLGPAAAGHWLADSLEVAEIHVHPAYQGQGTGRRMMLRLAAGRPERTALLSTPDGNTRARRLYHSLGFTDLLPAFGFPGIGPTYAIMGAELPLREAPPPARPASPSR